MIRLKIVTDETAEGTRLLNADTGEEVRIEGGIVTCHVRANQPPPPETAAAKTARLEREMKALRTGKPLDVLPAPPHVPNRASVRIVVPEVALEVDPKATRPFEWFDHRIG